MGRVDALWRLLLIPVVLIGGYALMLIVGILLLPYFPLSILWQLATGKTAPGGKFIASLVEWNVNNVLAVFTAQRDFKTTP